LAAQAKIDPASITPSAAAQAVAQQPQSPRGPGAADIAAAESMSPEARNSMIRTMVDSLAARLESNPDDLDGWLRLGRARQVLGENDKSVEAYAKAAALAPDRLDVQTTYANALFAQHRQGEKLAPEFVTVMRHILDLDPNYGDALWFVGLAEVEAGNRMAAITLWQRLLDRLPSGSQEREQVQAQIDRVKQATN
jgi:cytochrome c-type biogenesis protein CcmH